MKYLWSPLSYDIKKQFYLTDKPQTYTIKAEKINEYENETVYNHLRDYLVEIILNERNIVHFDDARAEVRKEVEKTL